MGQNPRGRDRCCTILRVTNVCLLPHRNPMVRHLVRLGAHTNLSWSWSVRIYFEDTTTTAHTGQNFINHWQADQASAEIRGTRAQGKLSAKEANTRGTEYPYDRSITGNHRVLLRIIWARRRRSDYRVLSYNRALELTGRESIETTLRARRLLWAGALIRMDDGWHPKRVMFGTIKDRV